MNRPSFFGYYVGIMKRKLVKRLLRGFGAFVAVVALVVVLLPLYVTPLVRQAVTGVAPMLLGTPIAVSNLHVNVFAGRIVIDGMTIGNPQGEGLGFKDDTMFSIEHLVLDVSIRSVLRTSEPILVREVILESPAILYEMANGQSNFDAVLARLGGEEEEEGEDSEEDGGRKYIVELFRFVGGELKYRHPVATVGKAVPVPLPRIVLTDIGKSSAGFTAAEALSSILTGIVKSIATVIADTVGNVGKGAGDLLGNVGSFLSEKGKTVGNAAKDKISTIGEKIKNLRNRQ